MERAFKILEKTRNNIISSIEGLSIDDLNKIPEGFNNNIAWNIGHLIVTQRLLCYKMSNLDVKYKTSFIDDLKKGAKPTETYKNIDIILFKKELVESTAQIKIDYENGLFKEYNNYTTSYGIELKSIEDAIEFNNIHEALHFGYIMAIKRSL